MFQHLSTPKPPNQKTICLLSNQNDINIFKLMPRTFTITTNHSSGIFNVDLLMITSNVISEFLKENTDSLQYHLDIDDDKNILSKFEKIYQGEAIELIEEEFSACEQITQALYLVDFPYRMKSSELLSTDIRHKINFITEYSYYNIFNTLYSYKISQPSFIQYIKTDISFKKFIIQTNQNEYECNIFGVLFSSVIRDFIIQNPKSDRFIYDFDEMEDEFQLICKIFNFDSTEITKDNSELIKEIAEELKIDCILDKNNDFIGLNEKVSQTIDEQQNIIDRVDSIFELLFNIDKKTVDFVANQIIMAEWLKNDENIYDLASFIFHVARSKTNLQTYLVDLLVKLNENEKGIKILLPFVIQNSINFFKQIICHDDSDKKNKHLLPFIYQLYKRKFIPKEIIINNLKNYNKDCYLLNAWFLPELIEIKHQQDRPIKFIQFSNYLHVNYINDIKFSSIEEYIEFRDKGEDNNAIKKALREDDIDMFQSIVSNDLENSLTKLTTSSIFEPFNMRYINYAARYGSIKCFKYLKLNNEEIDDKTFENAIIGGNTELIRIIYNDNSKENSKDILNKAIIESIKIHRNDLFDWLFDANSNKSNFYNLVTISIECCNIYSLVQIIEKGFAFNDYIIDFPNFIEKTSKLGYYSQLKFLIKLIGENMNKVIFFDNNNSFVYFGNIYIFKIFEEDMKKSKLRNIFYCAIKQGFLNIIEYIYENHFKQISKFRTLDAKSLFENCFLNDSNEIFEYIFEKVERYGLDDPESLLSVLPKAFCANKNEAVKSICNLINKKNPYIDFTEILCEEIKLNHKESVNYIIENKYLFYDDDIASKSEIINSIDTEIFSILINNFSYTAKLKLLNCIDAAISSKNKPLIEYLLKEDAPIENALLKAVEINDLEIVEMILKKNSDPSYINKCSKEGTALFIAVSNSNLSITKKLLSLPGIDPNIGINFLTPLIISIKNYQLKIFNSIVEFYGEDIKKEKWQFEKSLQYFEASSDVRSCQLLLQIIKLNIIDLNFRFSNNTILTLACKNGWLDVVDILIQNDKIDVNSIDLATGNSPFMLFISILRTFSESTYEIINRFINHKSINLNHKNYIGQSALVLAAQNNQSRIVELIIKNDKFNPIESDVNLAFYCSNFDTANKLSTIESIDVNYIPFQSENLYVKIDKHNFVKTPLVNSIIKSDLDLFKLIAKHKSFDKDKSQYKNAFYISLITKKNSFFTAFLEIFNDLDINAPIITGNTPLIEAVNHLPFNLSIIINHPKFDPKKSDIVKAFSRSLTKEGNFKLLYDFDCKHDHLIDQEIKKEGSSLFLNDNLCIESFNFLKSLGIDPNNPSRNGIYPLEFIIQNDKNDIFNIIIDSNIIDLNKPILNKYGESEFSTYLHLIARLGKDQMLKKILDKKLCDINITNDMGDTPLMEACKYKKKQIINRLFKYDDLDFLHRNNNGEDALDVVQKSIEELKNSKVAIIRDDTITNKDEYYSKLIKFMNMYQKNKDMHPNVVKENTFSGDKKFNNNYVFSNEQKDPNSSEQNKTRTPEFKFNFSKTESKDINQQQKQTSDDKTENNETESKKQKLNSDVKNANNDGSHQQKNPSDLKLNSTKDDSNESKQQQNQENLNNELKKSPQRPKMLFDFNKADGSNFENTKKSPQPQWQPEFKFNFGKTGNANEQTANKPSNESKQPQIPSSVKLCLSKKDNSEVESKDKNQPESKQPQIPSSVKLNFGKTDNSEVESKDKNQTESRQPQLPSSVKLNFGKTDNANAQTANKTSNESKQPQIPSSVKLNFGKTDKSEVESKDKSQTESRQPQLPSSIKLNFGKKDNSETQLSKADYSCGQFNHEEPEDSNKPFEKAQVKSTIQFDQQNAKGLTKSPHLSISESHTIFSKETSIDSPKAKFDIHNESFSEKQKQSLENFSDKQSQSNKNDRIDKIQRKFEGDSFEEESLEARGPISRLPKRAVNERSADFLFDDEVESNQIPYYHHQLPFADNNQMMYLQQQQQQWLQMIQMNNELQARINFQLMNQSAFELKKRKQPKKKKNKTRK